MEENFLLETKDYLAIFLTILSSFLGAFFAFMLFIWGEKRKEKQETINTLNGMIEYVALFIAFFIIHKKDCEDLKSLTLPSLFIKKLDTFYIEKDIFKRLSNLQVSVSLLIFISKINISNKNIEIFNNYLTELSEISRIAMIEPEKYNFKKTFSENKSKIILEIDKHLEFLSWINEESELLSAELEFSKNYIKSCFIKKIYFFIQNFFQKDYRNHKIQEIVNTKKTEQKNNL